MFLIPVISNVPSSGIPTGQENSVMSVVIGEKPKVTRESDLSKVMQLLCDRKQLKQCLNFWHVLPF